MADKTAQKADVDILARSPGPSYQDLLDKEVNPVPDSLRENTNPYLGSENLSVDRYLSREFHEKEVEHVWQRTWQAVCRETEVGEPGDTHVYDITRFSIIVTRTEAGKLKAFQNAVGLQPNNAEARHNLGQTLRAARRPEEAKRNSLKQDQVQIERHQQE